MNHLDNEGLLTVALERRGIDKTVLALPGRPTHQTKPLRREG